VSGRRLSILVLSTLGASLSAGSILAQDAPPSDSTEVPPVVDQRPSFLLPDLIVEGEDLSRFTGGMRDLEVAMPGVAPRQKPLLVGPEETSYRRRASLPATLTLPPPHVPHLTRGLLHVSLDASPGGEASLACLPSIGAPHFLWCDVEGWTDRLPDRDHLQGAGGWIWAPPGSDPSTRLAVRAHLARDRWGDRPSPFSDSTRATGEHRWLNAAATAEQRTTALGTPWVIRLRARGGEAQAAWEEPVTGGQVLRQEATGRWISADLGFRSVGSDERSRPEVDAWAGVAGRESPADSNDTVLRWNGHLGFSHVFARGRLGLGIAGGGDDETDAIGPWITWQRSGWRMEIAPRVTFSEEMFEGRPGPGDGPVPESPGIFATRKAVSGYDPVTPRRYGRRFPTPSGFDPRLPPQRAWPRVASQLLVQGEAGWVRLDAEAAELKGVISWSSGRDGYVLANQGEGWIYGAGAELLWRPGGGVEAHLAYTHTEWDAGDDAPDELTFLPRNELSAALRKRFGSLLAGLRLHWRGSVSAGEGMDPMERFVAVSATIGWSLPNARLIIVGENLSGEEVLYRPGDGCDDAWVRLVWEHTFSSPAP